MKALKAFETPQKRVKIKISVSFLSLSVIGTGRVKIILDNPYLYLKKWIDP